jgi:hypothetical protein
MKVASKPNMSEFKSEVMCKGASKHRAFTLADLVAVMAVVAVLAAMLLRAHASTKADASRINCARNLKQVGLAYQVWAASHTDAFPQSVGTNAGGPKLPSGWGALNDICPRTYTVYLVMSNELNTPKVLVCPADIDMRPPKTSFIPMASGVTGGAVFTNNTATSYFVGRDANLAKPRMLLAGDRNVYGPDTGIKNPAGQDWYGNSGDAREYLGRVKAMGTNSTTQGLVGWTEKLHLQQGNSLMSDGSVEQFNSYNLRQALGNSGDDQAAANIILFP